MTKIFAEGKITRITSGNSEILADNYQMDAENIVHSANEKISYEGTDKHLQYFDKEIEDKELNPAFLVHFRRLKAKDGKFLYDGEFGFDWMRGELDTDSGDLNSDNHDAYKFSKICLDYEDLKQLYSKCPIQGYDYYIPWLTLYLDGKSTCEVKLKLRVKKIGKSKLEKGTISFNCPEEIVIEPKEINAKKADEHEVLVKCLNYLTIDKTVEIKCDGIVVGKLNILKNIKRYKLPIKFVTVTDSKNNLQLQDLNDSSFNTLKSDLQNKVFNQALINLGFNQNDIHSLESIDIDFVELSKKTDPILIIQNLPDPTPVLIGDEDKSRSKFKKILREEYVKKYGIQEKGLIIFLTVVQVGFSAAAFATEVPTQDNFVVMGCNSILSYIIMAHEMGHTLGIKHSFETRDETDEKIARKTQYISELEESKKINEQNIQIVGTNISAYNTNIQNNNNWLHQNRNASSNTTVSGGHSIQDYRQKLNDENTAYQEKIDQLETDKANFENEIKDIDLKIKQAEVEREQIRYMKNKFVFNMAETENIMDYDAKSGETVKSNPHQKRFTFFKHQWEIMQNEVETEHGEIGE